MLIDPSFREVAATADEQTTPMGAFYQASIAVLRFTWQLAREIAEILSPCRFSVLVIAVGGFAILATGPGGEVIAGFRGTKAWEWGSQFFYFQSAVLLWALNSWFWARYALERHYSQFRDVAPGASSSDRRRQWLWYAVPRALGLAAYGTVIIALVVYGTDGGLIVFTLLVATGYLLFVWKREVINAGLEYGSQRLSAGAAEFGARLTTTYRRLARRDDPPQPPISRVDGGGS